jgi:NADH:ubiquinone oxidoreductase subunit K
MNNTAISLFFIAAPSVAYGLAVIIWAYRQRIEEARHGK